jgi:predicted HicB family RNase H-like nuclease
LPATGEIRTTKELHKRLVAHADKNRRSINREAERQLEQALGAEEASEARKK